MFFSVIGILSIFIINQSIHLEKSRLYTGFSVVMVILVSTFVGYGSYQQIGPRLLELPLPRLSGGQIKSGSAPLWSYLENLLHIEYKDAKLLLPTLAGFLIATILVLVVLLVTQRFKVRQGSMQNFGLLTINIILFIGLILSPTPVLIIESEIERCGGDVISTYEQVGEYLNQVIPPNSTIYWEAGLSVIPMLYLPGVNFYVPQINDGYSYRIGGNADQLLRHGLWNDELSGKWIAEADFILIEEWRYNPGWKNLLESGEFQELERTIDISQCDEKTGIRVFRRSE